MIERIVNLWNTKRWLFWLIFPLAIVAVVIKFYLDYLENKSSSDMKETIKATDNLREKKEEVVKKANESMKKANEAAKKIEERKVEDVDVDWHLKDK